MTIPLCRWFAGAPTRERWFAGAPTRERYFCVAGAAALGAALGAGCRDLERFDTGASGAYCGRIIDSDFTRAGFTPGLGTVSYTHLTLPTIYSV